MHSDGCPGSDSDSVSGGRVERWTWQVGRRRQNQVSSGILWAQDSGWGEVPSWTAALRLGDCGFA